MFYNIKKGYQSLLEFMWKEGILDYLMQHVDKIPD